MLARLDKVSAETVANYTIAGLTISGAELIATDTDSRGGTAFKTVALTVNAMTNGAVYTVSVNNVKDVADNAITVAKTSSFVGKGADTTAPNAITAAAYDNTKIRVTFTDDSYCCSTLIGHGVNNRLSGSNWSNCRNCESCCCAAKC